MIHFKIILKFTPRSTTKSLPFSFFDQKFIPISFLSPAFPYAGDSNPIILLVSSQYHLANVTN